MYQPKKLLYSTRRIHAPLAMMEEAAHHRVCAQVNLHRWGQHGERALAWVSRVCDAWCSVHMLVPPGP